MKAVVLIYDWFSLIQTLRLILDVYIIWNTNREMAIPVKTSYQRTAHGQRFTRYEIRSFLAISTHFRPIYYIKRKWKSVYSG